MKKFTKEEIEKFEEIQKKQKAETIASGGTDWGQASVDGLNKSVLESSQKDEKLDPEMDSGK